MEIVKKDLVYWNTSSENAGLYIVIEKMLIKGRSHLRLQKPTGGRFQLVQAKEVALTGAELIAGIEGVEDKLFELWRIPNGNIIVIESNYLELHNRVAYDPCTKEGPFYLAEIQQ